MSPDPTDEQPPPPPADAPADAQPPAVDTQATTVPPEPKVDPDATTLPPAEAGGGPLARTLRWYRRRKLETEARWDVILGGVRRTGTVTKVILLHARYSFGYLSAGFLLSAPLTIGMRDDQGLAMIAKSVLLGLACAIPFALLIPFSQVDWGRMRLPEFKNLELALTRYATYAMVGVLVVFLGVQAFVPREHFLHWLCDVRVAWINLVLMFFAWVRTKFHTVLFRDFYTLKPGDDLVLSAVPGAPARAAQAPAESDPNAQATPAPSPASEATVLHGVDAPVAGDPALAELAARAAQAESNDSSGSEDTTLTP